MASSEVLKREEDILMMWSRFDNPKGESVKFPGMSVEKRIECLESLAPNVSNRRSRRWLNDRLLMELVPRLSANDIRSLFAPPPWGDDVPLSPFCLTNVGEWDKFRTIDMDKEAAFMKSMECSETNKKHSKNNDKVAVLTAWHRVDCRTRETLRHKFLPELIKTYEDRIRAFIEENGDGDVLSLYVHDPFHRLLLHGVCEFYNLVSVTDRQMAGSEIHNVTKIKKKRGSPELPNLTLYNFLKMSKEGVW
ncbi:unnamed protein product [Cuscuta epithymum]|uniref:R3H-associated N-terminal domain-containing protein n=1 Tax=Cuscuta epithymum TaxID=186058 RepID=A0AAV0E7J0_9ASTE|nr:unnamed protein product [Cuscuta epithymum]